MKSLNISSIASLVGMLICAPASAFNFEALGANASLDSSLTLGAAMRLESQDRRLIAQSNLTEDGEPGLAWSTNGDDGNLAFKKGDLIAGAIKLTSDFSLGWDNIGIFVRGSYLFDPILNDKDYFDPADYAGPPSRNSDQAALDRKLDQVRTRVGSDADLLDAYIYGSFSLGDRYVSVKLGKQVINWGESTFVQNGLNSLIAADASQLRVPGFQLSEVLTPVGMVSGSIDLSPSISLEAFYQFEWKATEPDPVGTFFATNDFVGRGGTFAEIGFGRCPEFSPPRSCAAAPGGSSIPRGTDIPASDDGQGGAALRMFVDSLGGAEIALYAANFHSRLPLLSGRATQAGFEGVAGTAQYFAEYPEDIGLFGLSFNAALPFGGLAIQGEYSMKTDQPIQIDEVETLLAGLRVPFPSQIGPFNPGEYIRGYRRFDISQADVSITKISGPISWLGTSQVVMLLEAAATQVHDMPTQSELRFEGPQTVQPGDPFVSAVTGVPVQNGGYAEQFSWGYRALVRLNYDSVFGMFNVNPTLIWFHDVNGTSPTPILNFVEHRRQVTFALDVTYLGNWEGRLGYTNYFGASDFNQLRDRDNVSLALRYSF